MFEFIDNTRRSFRKVKQEMAALKTVFNDWVQYLSHNQTQMEERIRILEARIKQLELERELTL